MRLAGQSVAEGLEQRTLLNAALSASIPTHLDPNSFIVQQQIFPGGTSTLPFTTPPQLNLASQNFYRFAQDNVQEGQPTTFSTSALPGGIDTALALYDSDGNLLQKVDLDQPVPSTESLSAVIPSGRQFELGVFYQNISGAGLKPFTLTAVVPPQVQNTTLKIDPTSGQLQFQANSGGDRFNSPTDVDFYPLDFTNGGASGTVTLNSASPDTRFFADLFVQDSLGNWRQVASGSSVGQTPPNQATLTVAPPDAQHFLTSGHYALGVSPLNLNSPATAYEVDLTAPVLAPGSVAGQTLSSPLALAPTAPGTAGASVTQAFSAPALFPFRAVDNGPVTITLNASLPPLVSIYDSTGNTLLAVAGSQVAGGDTVSATIQATKGQQFIARAGVSSGTPSGQMTLSVSQAYTPTALTATAASQQQTHLAVAPATGGQFFRISPPAGANYLILQLAPDSGSTIVPQVVALGSGLAPVQASAAAGKPATLSIDLSQVTGPLDVYVIGTAGTGTATLSFSALSVPQQIPVGQFATQVLDVKTAGFTSSVAVPAAGNLAGAQFYELSPGQSQTMTATSSSGAPLLLLRYVQSGSIMQLDDRALGTSTTPPTLTANLQGTLIYAVAALPLAPATGTIQFQVTSPTMPQGVGVAMAPNKIALPNQPPPTAPFLSQLKLNGQIINSAQQRDLFSTILPFNMTDSPTLTFTPNTIGGPLTVNISVLDASNNVLNTFTTTAGQALAAQTLSTLTTANAGQTVRLLVEPVAGHALGDGTYNLEVDVPTSDPNPFLATEASVSLGSRPVITSIPFGGSVTSSFTTSSPSVQYFSVTLPNTTTPFKIWTQDLDATANTDIKIYRMSTQLISVLPRIVANNLAEFDNEPPPSFDYFPANRSVVDAQVTVNNYHILDGEFTGNFASNANKIVIAVKNEQGAQGQFKINAGAVNEPLVGPGVPDQPISFGGFTTLLEINPENGTGTIFAQASVLPNEAILLNTPHGLQPNSPITLQATGVAGESVQLDIFDAPFHGIFIGHGTANASGVATITLPLGLLQPSTGYTLGISATTSQSLNNVTLHTTVSTSSAPNQPATSDSLTSSEGYVRMTPAPDGSFVDARLASGVSLTPVTVRKVAFFVTTRGLAHFSLSESGVLNPSFSLYQEQQNGGEFVSVGGDLQDFVSQPGTDGTYSFDAFVTPGLYVLKVVGNFFGPSHSTRITGSLPAYDASQITLDPTTAQNDTAPLQTIDNVFNFFSTEYYEVTAPGGVTGPFMLDLHNIGNNTTGVFDIAVFKKTPTGFTNVGSTSINLAATPTPTSVMLQTTDTPVPGDQYFIGVNRDLAATVTSAIELSLGPSFMIPQPGSPDLIPSAIQLTPDNGKTRVLVTVRNFGFGAAGSTHGSLNFSNYPVPSDIQFSGVGPFGSVSYITDWLPGATTDTVSFTADSTNVIAESSETDNSTSVALNTVDPIAPTASFALSDTSLNGEGATWGRYISGVSGVVDHVLLTGNDDALYQETITGGPLFGNFTATGGSFPANHVLDLPFDFGSFQPTSASSPNVLHFSVIDAFGLKSPDMTQKVDVVPKPQFLTSVTFDPQAKNYALDFAHDIVNEQETLGQLLGIDLPVVGGLNNQFLVHVEAKGTASLDPTKAVSLPLTGKILLEAVGQSLYEESFNGSTKPTDHLTFTTRLDIDSHTLDVTAASASLQLQNLQLLHYESPSIKVFDIGIAGVADVGASIKFGLDASLSAGAKIGIDPNILVDPLSVPDRIGVMSPTYIEPTITGKATAEGSVSVAGFDIASLSGTVALTLNATFGLDNNNPAKVFSFDDFFNHLALKVTGDLKVSLEADVAIIGSVWSYSHDFPFTAIDTTTQGIITQDPTASGTTALTPAQLQQAVNNPLSLLGSAGPFVVPPPTFASGNDPVGAYPIDPHPVIVIDPVTGRALTLQVVNGSSTPGVSIGNLSFAQRNGGIWSAPTVMSGGDVAEPSLSLTHDSASSTAAAVTVYEATNIPGSPDGLTLNQKLDDTEIRYRYFNGSSFGAEQSITNDSLLDSSPSTSFNASGKGVVAWVHNTSSTAMDASGNYSRNTQDIQAAIWNSATHSFGTPLAVSVAGDGKADFNPATYVDDAGKMYVVWVSGASDNNVLMYSTSTGGAWSAPQQLPIAGLAPGGSFQNLSIGRDKLGRINVIFSYTDPALADGSVHTALLDRAAAAASFTASTGYEVIDQGANYSDIQTTNEPDGSLVAYWQKGDGVSNGVYYSALTRSSTNPTTPWTSPMALTSTTDLTMAPSLAVDTNGHMDVLFHQAVPDGGQAAPPSPEAPVGVTLASGVGGSNTAQLPELTFSNGLFFSHQDAAVAGGTATGQATILNRGAASAQVTIQSFVGLPTGGTLINTQTITLGPGSTYNYSQVFPVGSGSQTYSVQVSSATGEAVTTADDISAATLVGLPDITIASFTGPNPPPSPGQPFTLTADVKNLSNAAIGAFDVTLYSGDPRFPNIPGAQIATQHVSGLAASADTVINFPMTSANTAGDFLFTVLADSGNTIQESVETNNAAEYEYRYSAEPAITSVTAVPGAGNTVTVTVNVSNSGNVPVVNAPVDLQISTDGGDFVDLDAQNVSIGAGQTGQLTFQEPAVAGDNIYRAMFAPVVNAFDSNITDNVGQAELVTRGLADVSVGSLALSIASPLQRGPLNITGVVSNTGIADADNLLVEVVAQKTGNQPVTVRVLRLPVVPANGQVNINIPIDTTNLTGAYTFTVQLNRLQEVAESSMTNDSASIQATFGAALPINNVVTAVTGSANTITFERDLSGSFDWVWVNTPQSGNPTQLLRLSQASTVGGSGQNDTLVFDTTDGVSVPASPMTLNGAFTANALNIGANQSIVLGAIGTTQSTLSLGGLTIDPLGTLDIGHGSVQIHYSGASPISTIAGYVKTGFNAGAFNGHGITSSAGNTNNGVGYSDNAGTITVKLTRFGDLNLDNTVNFADLLRLAQNYNHTAATWDQGDLNYDGTVGFADLLLLAQNFNQSAASASDSSATLLLKSRRAVRR